LEGSSRDISLGVICLEKPEKTTKRFSIFKRGGKTVPLQVSSGPEGSRNLRLPDFMTTALEGGKVVSLTHRPHLPSGNSPGTHFY